MRIVKASVCTSSKFLLAIVQKTDGLEEDGVFSYHGVHRFLFFLWNSAPAFYTEQFVCALGKKGVTFYASAESSQPKIEKYDDLTSVVSAKGQ